MAVVGQGITDEFGANAHAFFVYDGLNNKKKEIVCIGVFIGFGN